MPAYLTHCIDKNNERVIVHLYLGICDKAKDTMDNVKVSGMPFDLITIIFSASRGVMTE